MGRVFQIFYSVYKTGQPQKNIEYPFRTRDGTLQFAEGAIALVRDAAGRPAGFRGILHDITERKKAEAQLKEHSAVLERAKEAAERELEIGRRIQADFLPEELPRLPGWEIVNYFKAAREVAGDFYDAFTLSGGKRVGLVVADVTDKGVGAALFMSLFRSLIRAFADQHYSLGWMDVLSSESNSTEPRSVDRRRTLLSTGRTALKNAIDLTNNYITRNHGRTNMFATVFFGVLDPATGSMAYINGGQTPPYLIGPQGIKKVLEPTGPAVGLLPGMEFGIEQVDLEPGDILFACTDGVTDAKSPNGDFFDEERLEAILKEPAGSAQALLDRIEERLATFIGSEHQFDDITMLAVRREA
jgi:sigma-B regulation protein RsbU (phosphoserine phosphatase)